MPQLSSESEEDDNTTDEMRKARMYRKRKAAPGWAGNQLNQAKKPENYSTDPDTGNQLYLDPNDGMTYEWEPIKKAWFPRINEDFLAQYQMNYGFTKDGIAEPTKPTETKSEIEKLAEKAAEKSENAEQMKKKSDNPKWFDDAENIASTKVYVSGLPDGKPDKSFDNSENFEKWDEEEFSKYMSKCGVVDMDVRTNKPKVKLYRDEEGNFKGILILLKYLWGQERLGGA